ncbi:MAG TPA: DUF6665 family protein [Longimicrobiaceae bacterium]|nr:DUF6665 family protein [Longimicrobiaceae bacterium]
MPRNLPDQAGMGGMDVLEYEVVQEKAHNLARMGRRLEQALAALAAFDEARSRGAGDSGKDGPERESLVAAAGEALWYYIVQREVCGLRDGEKVMREMGVPREVRLRMGFSPTRPR